MGIFDAARDFYTASLSDNLKTKVKNGLVYDAKKKAQDERAAKLEKYKEQQKAKLTWKKQKSEWKEKRNQFVAYLADKYIANWKSYLDKRIAERKKHSDHKIPDEEKKRLLEDLKTCQDDAETEITEMSSGDIYVYIAAFVEYHINAMGKKKKKVPQLENVLKDIFKRAKHIYANQQRKAVRLAKKAWNALHKQADANKMLDKANQELSNIPMKIDEEIENIQTMFDKILGGALGDLAKLDDNTVKFEKMIAKLKTLIDPVVSAVGPLEVFGTLPILGDLSDLAGLAMKNQKPTEMSEDQIRQAVEKFKPAIPEHIDRKLSDIMDTIWSLMVAAPTMLINIIVQMLNVIWSKLKIITSIIPLGNMFPLNLIPAIIEFTPKFFDLLWNGPKLIRQILKETVKRKIAEAQALQISPPAMDIDQLMELAETKHDTKLAKRLNKKKTYNDVTQDAYKQLSSYGYTRYQLKKIQKEYKRIHDGSDKKMTLFEDDGEQNLPLDGSSLLGMANTAWNATASLFQSKDDKKEEPKEEVKRGYKEKKDAIVRTKSSVEDYEAQMKKIIAAPTVSAEISYDDMKGIDDVTGEFYEMYRKQFKQYAPSVALKNTIKATNIRKNGLIDVYEQRKELLNKKIQEFEKKMKEADPKSKDEIDGYKKNIESANDEIKELDQKIAVLKQ